jgi:hypothetical protein
MSCMEFQHATKLAAMGFFALAGLLAVIQLRRVNRRRSVEASNPASRVDVGLWILVSLFALIGFGLEPLSPGPAGHGC